MKRKLFRMSAGVVLAMGLLVTGGCNIINGIGQEVTAIGKGISNVSNDVHPYKEASAGRNNSSPRVQ